MALVVENERDPVATPDPFHAIREGVDAVQRPIEQANGLPNALYTEGRFFRRERDYLMAKTWVCVGFASDLPDKGYARPLYFMGWPLLLLRNLEGEIHVFHNVCSHRGMRLVREEMPVRRTLSCCYHGWSYDLDGNLKATPHIGGVGRHTVEGFDCCEHGLRSIRRALWHDMIFVNLSGDAPAFAEHVRPLETRWAHYYGKHVLDWICPGGMEGSVDMEVGCNWKLAVENYCEAYHLPRIHHSLNTYSPLQDHYSVALDGPFAGQGCHNYSFGDQNGSRLPVFPGWPEDQLREAEYLSFYPNVLLGIQADHFFAMQLEPVSVSTTREHLRVYYAGEEAKREEYAGVRAALHTFWRTVFDEDRGAVEGLQQGRGSPAFPGGVFSPVMDVATHHFHRWVADGVTPT